MGGGKIELNIAKCNDARKSLQFQSSEFSAAAAAAARLSSFQQHRRGKHLMPDVPLSHPTLSLSSVNIINPLCSIYTAQKTHLLPSSFFFLFYSILFQNQKTFLLSEEKIFSTKFFASILSSAPKDIATRGINKWPSIHPLRALIVKGGGVRETSARIQRESFLQERRSS